MEANLEYRKQQAERIYRETGFPVPEFVYSLVPVNRAEAAKLAFDLGLVTYNPEQGDRSIYIAEFEGLALCRRFNISVEQARSLNGKVYRSKNAAELFEALPTAVSAEDASTSEQVRRQNIQNQLLSVETAILKRRKVPVPDITTLADYLGWVSEFVVLSRMHTVTEILWDFQEHYNQALFNSASRSFDPLADWEKYIKGEVDLKDWKNGFGR